MASHIHVYLLLILITWFNPLVFSSVRLSTEKLNKSGFRVNMVRRDSLDSNLTFAQRVARAVERSMIRKVQIRNIITREDVQSTVRPENGEYVIEVGVGTPHVSIEATVDTGSDLVWTECWICDECFREPRAVYYPSRSTTYSKVPCDHPLCQALEDKSCDPPDCNYVQKYGDGSETMGILSFETWTIGEGFSDATLFHPIAFGCGLVNVGFDNVRGVVGLGRGPLSLISQIGPHVQSKFSYCLLPADEESQTSPLYFGESADLGPHAMTVPYVHTNFDSTFYYVPLQGISVDGLMLNIPRGTFDLRADRGGGVIVDSGTLLTVLADAAYEAVEHAFRVLTRFPETESPLSPLDLCFDVASSADRARLPRLSLHFQGGARWDIPNSNLFVPADDEESIMCLAIVSETVGTAGFGFSVLGNLLQQNSHVSFNNAENTFSFLPVRCASL